MLTTLTPLLMICLACSVIGFALSCFFAIITAIGINRRLGLISILFPPLAFYVCRTGGPAARLPLRAGMMSLAAILILGLPVAYIFHTHA